jgi:hypothetical protein
MRRFRPRMRRPSVPLVVALLALFVALGGPAQAAKLINGARIKAGTVGSKQIDDRSLGLRDLSPQAVKKLRTTPARSISGAMLRENAVDGRTLAPGSVLTGHVADNGLTAADLGTNAVGSDEIADNAVGQSEIRDGGVGGAEVADGAIDGRDVADGGLSVRDLARQVGTLRWPVDPLAAGECDSALVPVSGIQIAGDFLLISPTTAWPTGLVYTVNGTASETEFKVNVCNRGTQRVEGAAYTFNYAVLGF